MPVLRRIEDIETVDPNCKRCHGTGWVCENHVNKPWSDGWMFDPATMSGCNCGAGAPCPSCDMLALDTGYTVGDEAAEG